MSENPSPLIQHPLIQHRPAGIGHPYATSLDQRVPVLPLSGETTTIGVIADPSITRIDFRLKYDGPNSDVADMFAPMSEVKANAKDAAALAGGDGHLAEAQAESLGGEGGWAVDVEPVRPGSYRFEAEDLSGAMHLTPWFTLDPVNWTSDEIGTLTGAEGKLIPGSVEWLQNKAGVHKVRFALKLQPGEHVTGFGERFDAVDQRGKRLDAVVFEQYKSQGEHGRTYLPMPFAHVIGGDGWGFHLRTSRRSWYDVAVTSPDSLIIEVDLGGTPDETLDVALYRGTPAEVLGEFLDEVGRAEVLPDWVFRLWASGNEWNTQELVMARMDRHRDLEIPVGAVVIEAWSDEEGITIFRDAQYAVTEDGSAHAAADFSYPADGAWPDPKAMIEELHRRGIKVILWQIPLQKTRFDLGGAIPDDSQVLLDGEAMIRDGHAVLEADGSAYHNRGWWFPQALMPDLSAQRTRDWWAEKRRYLVKDLDVDGFKTDGGEHAWGNELRFADGSRGDEGNNRYPVHFARTIGDLLRSEGKAPVTFSRAGFTGSQAHGIFWAGDENSTWQAFRNSVTAGITAGACGIVYWGWDLAGFSGPVPDAELYIRASAASVFMPIMQYHSEFNHHQLPLRDRTPWFVGDTNADNQVVPQFRELAQLREALVPYLSQQAAESIKTNRPLMRGLFFDFPDDQQIWHYPEQYLLGDALLVHPVTEPGVVDWSTYLPADSGEWVDVWTGKAHAGGQITLAETPRNVVPVYCRTSFWSSLKPIFQAHVSRETTAV